MLFRSVVRDESAKPQPGPQGRRVNPNTQREFTSAGNTADSRVALIEAEEIDIPVNILNGLIDFTAAFQGVHVNFTVSVGNNISFWGETLRGQQFTEYGLSEGERVVARATSAEARAKWEKEYPALLGVASTAVNPRPDVVANGLTIDWKIGRASW